MVGLFVVFLSLVFFSPPNSMRLTICGKRSPFTLGLGSRNEENNGYSESTFRKNEGKKKKTNKKQRKTAGRKKNRTASNVWQLPSCSCVVGN